MLAIYEFYWDCKRMGDVEGVFIADKEEVAKVMGKHIYFGEILGKHSEISGVLEEHDLTIKSEDQDFIAKCIEVFGKGTISGYNPLAYYDPDQDRPEDEILESEIEGGLDEDDGC
jgi:hypothetical protein